MAVDGSKDQSYFLFPVTRDALEQTLFPLGGMTKSEVRAHAHRLGLITADKPESQEICFLPDGNHTALIRQVHGDGSGNIVDVDGNVLGKHDGYFRFTIGQRRGLRINQPMYVSEIRPSTREVVVGPLSALQRTTMDVVGMNWFLPPELVESARIRHRGDLLPASIHETAPGLWAVQFPNGVSAPAKGQAVVLYNGSDVVGGGWIKITICAYPRADCKRSAICWSPCMPITAHGASLT